MARLVPVLVRVDRDAKAAAEEILSSCDLTLADAVDLFLRQVVAEGGLPFTPAMSGQMSVGAMQDSLARPGAEDSTAMADEFVLAGRSSEHRFWTDGPAVTRDGPGSPGGSKARRELASMMRNLRPSVDTAPWWPETD